MRLTTKGRFAVTAMIDLALRQNNGPVTLAAISQRQQISLSYLEQLFGKLRRHELVESTRGPGGGYTLGRKAAEIIEQEAARRRSELAAQEAYEISEIQAWLPAALSAAELETIVTQAIADAGVTEMRDMGKAMALIKPQVQGRADMGEVSKLLKAKLSN